MKMKSKEFPKEFPFRIDLKLEHKLERLEETLKKRDVWILVDGEEGSGKTNMASFLLYWFHCMTGREFILERFYFDTDEMFEWVKNHSNGLINWDEACLGGLSAEWWKQSQINLLKFAMTGRILHHVFVLCIPRFDKLKIDLRKDRIHAMIHMDLGKRGNKYGHYYYLTKRGIRKLNDIWAKKKVRAYNSCARKYGGFFGDSPFVFPKILDEPEYNKKKMKAISNIGVKKLDKYKEETHKLKIKIRNLKLPITTQKELARQLEISPRKMRDWGLLATPDMKTGL